MKRLTIIVLLILFLSLAALAWLSATGTGKRFKAIYLPRKEVYRKPSSALLVKLHARAEEARQFVNKKGFNTTFCFLIDMRLPSGQNRFFVYDLIADSIRSSGLVTHGRCNEDWLEGRRYGNTPGCGCTSLGKYKLGQSYVGRFGLAYKLTGLEKTNDQAYNRFVVLHAHSCVPETEVAGEICQSDGCPTVSPGFLKGLRGMLDHSAKPVLLWILP
jgi:hypothetical protein